MKNTNPYLQQIRNVLPRLLALYNTDSISPTYGLGDRYYWAWKLIDFGNGTFQGAAHGLARLLTSRLLPEELSESAVLRRIDAMFQGTAKLMRKNGSLEEAFPYESSFCVTALVAYDLLTSVELLTNHLDKGISSRYIDTIQPMIRFLHKADETYAFISNHLATAAAALYKWAALTGEAGGERGKIFLDRILNGQSDEGWFKEYEGADPGYQSLCTYYLADIHRLMPDLNLLDPLCRSIKFLWHFAHPDGSFGGNYGSRNTRFYYPAGIEALASEIPEAAALCEFMRQSIGDYRTVTLEAMDEPNLIPMFNSYCWAADLYQQREQVDNQKKILPLPAISDDTWQRQFKKAGILIDKSKDHYSIISWHKGGVCYHFSSLKDESKIDVGVIIKTKKNQYYSTQAYQQNNSLEIEGDTLTITTPLVAVHRQLPTPIHFIILRLLNVTVMRNFTFGNHIKKVLVRFLITGKKVVSIKNIRTIRLGPKLGISDSLCSDNRFSIFKTDQPFSVIHMASQGYWQVQDDTK